MGKNYPSKLTKDIHRLFDPLLQRHSKWQAFSDFLIMTACAISNSVDIKNYEMREKQYMDVVKKYTSQELDLFAQILAELINVMGQCVQDGNLKDILGVLFHELKLHNERKGQFFTPQEISDMIAIMTMGDITPEVEQHGFFAVAEPSCGSGDMMISAANATQRAGYNYCTQMVVDCTDIDISCVHMCYIQLSYYGIPAVVRHGNTLLLEVWSSWYTTIFMAEGWCWKYRRSSLLSEVV